MIIDADTARVLAGLTIDGPIAAINGGQLDRKLYVKVNAVLGALGGTWRRSLKVHAFERGVDVQELLDGALAAGKVVTVREAQQALGWFPTPDGLADQLVEWAKIRPGDRVLEPSAGEGALVRAIRRRHPETRRDRAATIHAIEIAPARAEKLIDAGANRATCGDFMLEPTEPARFEAVVANFPFCKSGRGDHLDHLRHAFTMLTPGGRLAAVMPAGIKFRADRRYRETRELIEAHGDLISLPSGSFKASGTNVETCAVRMVKP